MKEGKIPSSLLKACVFQHIKGRSGTLLGPAIGEDCCAITCGDGSACVLSSDPITGSSHEGIAPLAVYVACNDLASAGVAPRGLLVTVLLPPSACEEDLTSLMQGLSQTAEAVDVAILGGHTEVTRAVRKTVLMVTAVGTIEEGKIIRTAGAKVGDELVMTKTAGLEGTAILAAEKGKELERTLGRPLVERAKAFLAHVSVIPEGLAVARGDVHAMHDATEGGVLGAIWEVCEASHVGVHVCKGAIPVAQETKAIAEIYGIDPLRLMASGSLLIAAPQGKAIVRDLAARGIAAAVVGRLHEGARILEDDEGKSHLLEEPGPDQLYRALSGSSEA